MVVHHFDSAAFARSRFPIHGQSSADVQGRVLRNEAQGPFNLELAQAHVSLLTAAGRLLPADRRFVECHVFRGSLLMPRPAWELVTAYVDKAVEMGFCAQATVIVLGPEVEGQELFGKGIERIWSRSRPVVRVHTVPEGEAAIARLLVEHGLNGPLP